MRVGRLLKRVAIVIVAAITLAVAVFAIGVLWPERDLPPVRTEGPLAIVGVTVIDLPPETRGANATGAEDQTVLVEDGRIVAVGREGSIAIPQNATTVDGRGRYLLPGLWDMHAHVYAVSPLLDLPLYIAYGVTNLRDMQGCPEPGDPFIACPEEKRQWTAEALAFRRIAPRVVSSASFMANGPGIRKRLKNVPEFFETATPDQARAFVRHFAGRVEAMKVYDRIPRDAYLALVDEARARGLEVVGHRPHAVSAIEVARNQRSIEHARFILHESFPGAAALREAAGTSRWKEDRRRMVDEHDLAMADDMGPGMCRRT